MKRILIIILMAALCLSARAQETDTLHLSTMYTTHLIFPSELSYVDVSSKAIAAKVIETNKNILALKARAEFGYSTTISALESNGEMHTYIVVYDPSPEELVIDMRTVRKTPTAAPSRIISKGSPQPQDMASERQRLFHIADRNYHIEVLCEDVFVSNDVTYFILSLKNRSGISYDCADAGFMIESRKKSRRGLDYQRVLEPKSRYGTLSTASGKASRVVYTMDKVTLSNDQVLSIYIYETGGSRNFTLTLTSKDINDARLYR